jgi:hypothetical protein
LPDQIQSTADQIQSTVLPKEKKKCGIDGMESMLSSHSWITNDPSKYAKNLQVKMEVDRLTCNFYRLQKWKGWKFRMFCRRKAASTGC